jgi:hypothetical protein
MKSYVENQPIAPAPPGPFCLEAGWWRPLQRVVAAASLSTSPYFAWSWRRRSSSATSYDAMASQSGGAEGLGRGMRPPVAVAEAREMAGLAEGRKGRATRLIRVKKERCQTSKR